MLLPSRGIRFEANGWSDERTETPIPEEDHVEVGKSDCFRTFEWRTCPRFHLVRNFDGAGALIEQWLKNKDTVLFLGVWERINNPGFNSLEFEGIRNEAGRNSFFMSAKKWIQLTGAIGLIASAGRYGGTYAHKDIAFEFGSWLSPEFKLYLITEFQRLKDDENDRLKLGWNLQRTLAKINYRILTDAIKETLLPPAITKAQAKLVYANEADLLNVALFGRTAKQWRDAHPDADGNIRDHAPLEQLVVLTNLESLNAVLIRQGLPQPERLLKLNEIAITQMRTLLSANNVKRLK
ncbi:MAG: KilA-N domain-containing protein [Verrucomicrobiales bacterium]|nr:KilA-N domain-containing protein [Verrucomicrobiales bacterium]